MLSLLLRSPDAWDNLLSQEPSFERFRENLRSRRFLTVEISLIQHRGTEFLEDIFLKETFREISAQTGHPFEGAESRHDTFQEIRRATRGAGFSGVVFLIDELSEFLRSKADAHAYHEDIRFLQYLGEEAFSFPLWIIASLQEWIEETGEINQETFNKIKDRYPVRISLGRSHIEEIVSHRLISRRQGSEEEIRKIFLVLRRYFPLFPVDEPRFIKLYPVHPATIAILDRLKPLFSEHRGIIDFIHYRLKGDVERGIPSFLDRPAQELLGPSAIFDHFFHRIRETAETQPFVEKGFDYYRDEIPQIFKDPEQQKVAFEAVKLLILFAISPIKMKYTVRHLAEMILFRVTDLESEINYQYLRDILDRLAKESAYLAVVPGKDPLDEQFAITLRPDLSIIMRQKIRQGVSEIFPGDRRLFERLLPLADSPHLPFAGWAEQGKQKVSTLWEHTRRHGTLLLRQIDEVSPSEGEALAEEWTRSEDDFFIIVGTTLNIDKQYQHLRDPLLPKLRGKNPGTFLFWIPAHIGEEDEGWMRELLSCLLLFERYQAEFSEPGQQMKELLSGVLNQGKKRLGEILTRAYFDGLLLWDDRQSELSSYGYLSQEKFLQEFLPPLLSRRFPKHHRIHPYMEALAPTTIPSLLRDFFATGMLEVDDRSKFGLRAILDELLKPMGLVKKKGNQYFLHVDPRGNELAEHILSLLERGPLSPEGLYWSVRKGDYGLLKHQFDVLLFALLFSGNILAYQGQRKKGLEDISRSGLQGITALGKGEILSEELRKAIPLHPLLPEKLRKGALTLPSQESLWNEIRARKEAEVESLQNLLNRLTWASSFQAFQGLPWDSFRRAVEDVLAQWEEVKVSFPPKEGLERFLSAANKEAFLSEKLRRLEDLRSFFDHAEKILFVYQYLADPRLSIPGRPAFQALREEKDELLGFFETGKISIDSEVIRKFLGRFQGFRERYIQAYTEAHRKARSDDQFAPYEKLRHSRRYQILHRLDQLEMISVRHNRSSVDRLLTGVLLNQCEAPSMESLQNSPACRCGFLLTTEARFTPAREIEAAIDLGIRETLEALNTPTYQEKLLPYLKGLEEVGENEKASAIRRLLKVSAIRGEELLSELDQALTPLALQGINEAFRGRVVVVSRDLDQLYAALIRRKYTLPQVQKIIRDWLKEGEFSPGTFIHFIGRGDCGEEVGKKTRFLEVIETDCPHLLPLVREGGPSVFKQALLLSLWIEGYQIPPGKIFSLFPFFEKAGEEKGDLLVQQLSSAARGLRQNWPDLFEEAVQEVEKEEETLFRALRLLEGETSADLFRRETIFPSILRQGFEKLLAASDEEKLGSLFDLEENPSRPPGTHGFLAKRTEIMEALRDYDTVRQKLQALKRRETNPPQDFQKWETLYTQHLSPLSFFLAVFPLRAKRMEVNLPSPARERLKEGEDLCLHFSKGFSEFYREALPLWEREGVKGPRRVEDLASQSFWKKSVSEAPSRIFVLMDGMRWDLWEYLKERFFAPMANQFRIIHEGPLWAHLPSSTTKQMEPFEEALQKAGTKDREMETRFWKIGGIDERVHTEKGTLEHLFRNVLQFLQLELAPRLRDLPSRTLLIFFSDHGFVENPLFERSDKYRSSRYTHGEASPYEIIVPWAVITRI